MIGVVVAVATFALNRNLIPYSKRVFQNTIIKLTGSGVMNSIKSGQFFTEIPHATLFAEQVAEDGVTMNNVFIQTSSEGRYENMRDEQIIVAKNGRLIKQVGQETGFNTVRLLLKDGNILKIVDGGKVQQKIIFKEYDFPIMSDKARLESVNKHSMRTSDELLKLIAEYKKTKIEMTALSAQRTLDEMEQGKLTDITKNIPKMELEYYSRWNTPIQCLVFIFLGVSIGIKHNRGKTRNSAAYSLLILIVYYVVMFAGISVANRGGAFHPAMAVFLPSILGLGAGVYFFKKIQWPA
jgi:lipopolysaccharide export system permease protein